MHSKWYSISRENKVVWFIIIGVAGILLGLLLGRVFSRESGAAVGPAMLSAADRSTWVVMASDSFSSNADIELARERLARLKGISPSWKPMASFIEATAVTLQDKGDDRTALQLRQMSAALNLPEPDAPEASPAAQRRVEVWRILLFIAAVITFLALVALAMWLMARQTLKRQALLESSASDEVDSGVFTEQSNDQADELFDHAPSHALSSDLAAQHASGKSFMPIEEITAEPQRVLTTPRFQAPDPRLPVARPAETSQPAPLAVGDEGEVGILGTFEAEYSFGTDDFDCSFTISSPDGTFLGDCGVGVSDVLPAIGPQHVDALEVWLFDKGDVSSVSKFLVSEYAYENLALNNRLSVKGELVPAEAGALITLETRSLRITAQVLTVEYDMSVDPNKSYFRRVTLEIIAELAD